jgi:hypothetical protein
MKDNRLALPPSGMDAQPPKLPCPSYPPGCIRIFPSGSRGMRLLAFDEFRRLCRMAGEPPTGGEWNAFYARLTRPPKMRRGTCAAPDAEIGWAPERLLRFPVLRSKHGFGTRTRRGEAFIERPLSLGQTYRPPGRRDPSPPDGNFFECRLSGSKPVALFSDARESCRSVNSARSLLSLSLSLSLSLKLCLIIPSRKQSWQPSAGAAFCRFPGIAPGDRTFYCKQRDPL